MVGYVHVGDENKDTTWYIRTINVSYDGKLYKSATVRQFEKTDISKNGGIFKSIMSHLLLTLYRRWS